MLSKYLLPPDVFIRHWLVANEIKKNRIGSKVLDVGGSLGEMRKFLPGVKIVTTDVVPGADILYDGKKLPFKKENMLSSCLLILWSIFLPGEDWI